MSLMNTKIAGKPASYYWKAARLPVFAAIALSVLQLLMAMVPFFGWAAAGVFSVLGLLIPAYLGWNAVKSLKYGVKQSGIAGALGGLIAGLVGGIVSAISAFFVGSAIAGAMATAGAYAPYASAVAAQAQGAVIMGAIFGLFTGPVFGAITWAIIALIGAVVAENV